MTGIVVAGALLFGVVLVFMFIAMRSSANESIRSVSGATPPGSPRHWSVTRVLRFPPRGTV